MPDKKCIIIGSDDVMVLTRVLNIISAICEYKMSTITVSRTKDLNNSINSLNPDLVILGFRTNQAIIKDDSFNTMNVNHFAGPKTILFLLILTSILVIVIF
jgi:hypothetical protein